MKPLAFLERFLFSEDDALAGDRDRIMAPVLVGAAILLTVLLIDHILNQRPIFVGVNVAVILLLSVNSLAFMRGKAPPIPYSVLLGAALIAIGAALTRQSINGALWSYPALILCCFALPRRVGFVFSVALILTATSLTAINFDTFLSLRVCATLLLTWLICNIVINVLIDLHRKLLQQTITDPLTGALNRRQMDVALGELLRRARGRPAPASILLIDIDNFKQINDQRGHGVGDEVLVGLVKLITARKRTVDSLYRIGGEEFLLLLQDSSAQAAALVAEQLRALIEDSNLAKGVPLTISVGVAECEPGYAPSEWLKAADEALYRAKDGGRNRVENSTFGDSDPRAQARNPSQD